jgi:hypothetical protein
MMSKAMLALLLVVNVSYAATTVPNEAQMPGTQPQEVKTPLNMGVFNATDPAKQCNFCHGDYNKAVEPTHNWQGSMMSHAARDPLFWAQLAIAEQDFDGAGDVCLRCHMHNGWESGRSVPTDGSAMLPSDAEGVECDVCHRLTNPDQSEHKGVQNPPFIANKNGEGFYGSGMAVLWPGLDKLGPYADSATKHPSLASKFHRSVDFCGTCHDVSNPVVGDLAPNHGAQVPLAPGTFSGILGTPVEGKAAFNNPPYKYGIVERTFSEYKSSLFPTTLVSDYLKLPADLQDGAIKAAFSAALATGKSGNYENGDPRYFSCQTCHMSPVTGEAASRIHNKPVMRKDQPLHDLTGANYWIPQAIQYLDKQVPSKLRLGQGLKPAQIAAMNDGIIRAKASLSRAGSLKVSGNTLKVTNLTGHKLISGYPEGRRMWLNVKWYNSGGVLVREDGKYGPLTVTINGANRQVNTILNLSDANTRIYEAHGSVTKEWANKLIKNLGASSRSPLMFDRVTGQVAYTLGDVAALPAGSYRETFHFILNNYVAKDNRIPPYGMRYDEARKRNTLPVPASQFGNPGAGGTYRYWDDVALNPPSGAARATIDLLYQPTSWEYIQFLYLANKGTNTFLANEGANLLDAWLNTGMAEPHVMASTTWISPNAPPKITGFWPGKAPVGSIVFVFGSDFVPMGTQMSVNSVNAPIVQSIDPTLLFFMLPAGDTTGPITAKTANGSASSSTNFGVLSSGLTISGMWPGTTKVGALVFVFGSGYQPLATKVQVNGMSAPIVQVVDPNMLVFMLPPGASSGKVTVTTSSPAASITSAEDLVVLP